MDGSRQIENSWEIIFVDHPLTDAFSDQLRQAQQFLLRGEVEPSERILKFVDRHCEYNNQSGLRRRLSLVPFPLVLSGSGSFSASEAVTRSRKK